MENVLTLIFKGEMFSGFSTELLVFIKGVHKVLLR